METALYLPVLNNFENLFKSKKNYDVIIKAGEEQKEIYAHSIVLCCSIQLFWYRIFQQLGLKKGLDNGMMWHGVPHQIIRKAARTITILIYCLLGLVRAPLHKKY